MGEKVKINYYKAKDQIAIYLKLEYYVRIYAIKFVLIVGLRKGTQMLQLFRTAYFDKNFPS